MHNRLLMDGWTAEIRRVGHIHDVSIIFGDLAVFYRDPGARRPKFVDPNPLLGGEDEEETVEGGEEGDMPGDSREYFRVLYQLGEEMARYKTRSRV